MHDLSSNGPAPTLHLVCGKIGAGKSTLSQQLALKQRHVLISEDAWPFQASDEEFERITRHFVAPAAEEGFVVMRYTEAGPA
ncbi:hypothetical protein ABW45_17885 [Stenotrophomonas maltophilia]|nr:AAA family ATPase [Stenotrophomonas pavanii]KOQ73273.1 hypothetical protein ABW45_17885 [Stenotrophomonas maltophilia]